jgi:hypothetical protein
MSLRIKNHGPPPGGATLHPPFNTVHGPVILPDMAGISTTSTTHQSTRWLPPTRDAVAGRKTKVHHQPKQLVPIAPADHTARALYRPWLVTWRGSPLPAEDATDQQLRQ